LHAPALPLKTIKPPGGTLLPYTLDEGKNWALSIDSLRKTVAQARADGKAVRGLVFINPGNPTGQCLDAGNLQELIK
jgi:aspartate/methionine/tyrosine aminotransferase